MLFTAVLTKVCNELYNDLNDIQRPTQRPTTTYNDLYNDLQRATTIYNDLQQATTRPTTTNNEQLRNSVTIFNWQTSRARSASHGIPIFRFCPIKVTLPTRLHSQVLFLPYFILTHNSLALQNKWEKALGTRLTNYS